MNSSKGIPLLISFALGVCLSSPVSLAGEGVDNDKSHEDGSKDSQALPKTTAVSSPLHGYAQETDMPARIQRPPESKPNSEQQGSVDQSQTPTFHQQASLINANDFLYVARDPKYNGAANDSTPAQQPVSGQTLGGQDEYWVDWNAWRWRVAQTVWAPLAGMLMWGCTKVDYDVTRDGRISISSIRTPDPTRRSGRILAERILQLQGNPVLQFPAGSKQAVHHNYNQALGLPLPTTLHRLIRIPGGTEHVVTQW